MIVLHDSTPTNTVSVLCSFRENIYLHSQGLRLCLVDNITSFSLLFAVKSSLHSLTNSAFDAENSET